MKVAIALALVVACAASTFAAPAPNAIDWRAVEQQIGSIESGVRSAVQQVKQIATGDNAQVGSAISNKLDAAAAKAIAILEQANEAVKDRTLTEAKARELLGQLKDILAASQNELKPELEKLSAAAAGQIRDIFYQTYAETEAKAKKLYELLAAFAPAAVNWQAVAAKVQEIETGIREAVRKIKDIANKDNAQVGAEITKKLDEAAKKAEALLQEASELIKNQKLTEAEAKRILGELKDLLAGVQQDMQSSLAQLSPAAAGAIRDEFYATYAKTEQKAQELYDLLRQFAPNAISWSQVAAKTKEIEDGIRAAVRKIKDIANKDNAQVGAEISKKLDEAAVKAEALLKQAQDKIKDQSLTEAEAKRILGELKDLLAGVQQDMQSSLAQLSPAAAGQIRDTFYATYAETEKKAQELYDLLRA